MSDQNNPLTRNSDLTVIERIKKEPRFGRDILHEAALLLLNRRELDVAQAMLRQIAEAVSNGETATTLYPALYKDDPPFVEDLNVIHDALFKQLVAIDPTIRGLERINWRAFVEKHKDDPPEPGGLMACNPEWYPEMCADGAPDKKKRNQHE